MRHIHSKLLVIIALFSLGWGLIAAYAQDNTCTMVAEEALQTANTLCDKMGRHEACYGHVQVNANMYPGQQTVRFLEPGDIADVSTLESLILSPYNDNTGAWGVAQMRIQANLPAESGDVTLLLFGSVEIENAVPPSSQVTVSLAEMPFARVYEWPTARSATSFWAVRGMPLTSSEKVGSSSWLKVEDSSGRVGWIQSSLVSAVENQSLLSAGDSAQSMYRPMQAFYFKTSTEDAPACTQLPPSGLLVQTPEGNARVSLLINEVNISLGSTIFVANENQTMVVALLEGHAKVSTPFGDQTLLPGTQVDIPMSADSRSPNGPPSNPYPYGLNLVQTLPTAYLPLQFQSAAPIGAQIPISQNNGQQSSSNSNNETNSASSVGSANASTNNNGINGTGNTNASTDNNGINGTGSTNASTDNNGINGTGNTNASTDNNGVNSTGNTNASTDNNGVNSTGNTNASTDNNGVNSTGNTNANNSNK